MNIEQLLSLPENSSEIQSQNSAFSKYQRNNSSIQPICDQSMTNAQCFFGVNTWQLSQNRPAQSTSDLGQTFPMAEGMTNTAFSQQKPTASGGKYQPTGNSRDRRPRTTFSSEQTNRLEEEFNKSEYISRTKRLRLADSLQLNEGQIKIWFQNRRAKDKRIEKAQMDTRLRYLAALSFHGRQNTGAVAVTNEGRNYHSFEDS